MGIIGLVVSGLYAGLTQINRWAESNRLTTCVTAAVLAQLDKALSVRPFSPVASSIYYGDPFDDTKNTYGSGTSAVVGVPSNAMITHTLGTATTGTVNIFLNSDLLASGSSVSASTVVTGTMTTLVNEAIISTGGTTAATGTSALRRISVSLVYQYRGNSGTVQMTGFRAPDQ